MADEINWQKLVGDMEWLEAQRVELDTGFSIKPGGVYCTYGGTKAVVVYVLENKIFFGHVFEDTIEGIIYVAVQWDVEGKVDQKLYDRGYDLETVWEKPTVYERWVGIYKKNDKGAITTEVSENPFPRNNGSSTLVASKKVVFT